MKNDSLLFCIDIILFMMSISYLFNASNSIIVAVVYAIVAYFIRQNIIYMMSGVSENDIANKDIETILEKISNAGSIYRPWLMSLSMFVIVVTTIFFKK